MDQALLDQLIALRHDLHRHPEISGQETETAQRITDFLERFQPDEVLTGLGGHGVAAIYRAATPGPRVMIRAELDALPIPEETGAPYTSLNPGRGHLCGHDGHMTMVAGLAPILHQTRPQTGETILLFQPAEETGQGAAALRADPRFPQIDPDFAFSLHNLPGLDLGHTQINLGPANCASRGMRILLTGRTSHAAAPQDGLSPADVIAELMPNLATLGPGGARDADFALTTLTHAKLGEPTFGIAPGIGEIWVTLRTVTDEKMAALVRQAETLVADAIANSGLTATITYDDVFEACTNHPDATPHLIKAAEPHPCTEITPPQSWSEDFGQFAKSAKTAMFWLGSGRDQPQLHNPDFDFPDALIPIGTGIFERTIRNLLG